MATPTYAGIQGRVFSVTGGTSGMGHATVRLLASNGAAEVWVADWNVSRGDEIIAEMATVNPNTKVHITKVDVSDSKQVDAWVSSIVAATGGLLHGCANVAGLPQNPSMEAGPALLQQDDDSWAKVLGVNLSGVMYCTRAQVREMIKMPKGSHQSIVNVSSMASLIHGPGGMYAYTASKAGCAHFTTCVAKDVYPYGIRANTVSPGTRLPTFPVVCCFSPPLFDYILN